MLILTSLWPYNARDKTNDIAMLKAQAEAMNEDI
jgi:hypothetical protein